MLAIGSLVFGAGTLVAGLLALLFRNPRAPRWTRPELVAMLAVIPVAGTLGLGFGYMLVGGYQLLNGAGERSEPVVLVAVALVVAGAWHFLARRLQAYGPACAPAAIGADAGAGLAVVAEGPPRPQPPGRPAPRSARKAA